MENYGTMGKKQLWYYGKNYGTILRNMELRFKKKMNMVDCQKVRNFDL